MQMTAQTAQSRTTDWHHEWLHLPLVLTAGVCRHSTFLHGEHEKMEHVVRLQSLSLSLSLQHDRESRSRRQEVRYWYWRWCGRTTCMASFTFITAPIDVATPSMKSINGENSCSQPPSSHFTLDNVCNMRGGNMFMFQGNFIFIFIFLFIFIFILMDPTALIHYACL